MGFHASLSPPWEGESLGPILTPQAPGLRLEALGGGFLLGPYPRPFHNGGKSAGLRVLGYCSLQSYPRPSDPLEGMSWALPEIWSIGGRARLESPHCECSMSDALEVGMRAALQAPTTLPFPLSSTCKHSHCRNPLQGRRWYIQASPITLSLLVRQRKPGSKLGEGQGIGQLPEMWQHDYWAREGSSHRPSPPPNMPYPGMSDIQAGTFSEDLLCPYSRVSSELSSVGDLV